MEMMHYQEYLKTLAAPWDKLFAPTKLIHKDNVALLVVPEVQLDFFCSLEALTKIYPIVKKLHPTVRSLHVVHGNHYQYIQDGHMEFINIKVT